MTLKKVHDHEKQCSLPHWMLQHHHTFKNLNASVTYHFNTLGTSLTITDEFTTKKLKCNTILEENLSQNDSQNLTRIIMQVNFEWWVVRQEACLFLPSHDFLSFDSESGFMCMEVSRKSDSIMSLRMGRLSRNPDEACDQHLFFDKSIEPVIMVSAKHGHRERCPLVGKYAALLIRQEERSNEQNLCLPNHKADHVTFGCATGGATEFNVIQNNCPMPGQQSQQTSSK